MSAPAADDEVGIMSAVSSESDAKDGRGKAAAAKDRAAVAMAGSEGEDGGSNSGRDESSDGGGESSDGEEVRGRYFDGFCCVPRRSCVRLRSRERMEVFGFPLFCQPRSCKDRSCRKAGKLCLRASSRGCKHRSNRGALVLSEGSQ